MKLKKIFPLLILILIGLVVLTGCDVNKNLSFKPKKDIELSTMVEIVNHVMFERGFVLSKYARPEHGQLVYEGGKIPHSPFDSRLGIVLVRLEKDSNGVFQANLNIQSEAMGSEDYLNKVIDQLTKILDSGEYSAFISI